MLTDVAIEANVVYSLLVSLGSTALQFWPQLRVDVTKPAECTALPRKIPLNTGEYFEVG